MLKPRTSVSRRPSLRMVVGFMDEQWRCHQLNHGHRMQEVYGCQLFTTRGCTRIRSISISSWVVMLPSVTVVGGEASRLTEA